MVLKTTDLNFRFTSQQLKTSFYPAVNGYFFLIRKWKGMGYTQDKADLYITLVAPRATKLSEVFTLFY